MNIYQIGMSSERSVVPLESNPDIFTEFAHDLGLNENYSFIDVYSLTDRDLLGFVPRPVKALILLFPLNAFFEDSKNKTPANKGDSEDNRGEATTNDQPVWFKQTIRNACGLYGLLHSLCNNADLLSKQSKLLEFLKAEPREDNKYCDSLTDDFVVKLSEKHSDKFSLGQTVAPAAVDDVNLHFITFVRKEGEVYELDGRRADGAHLISSRTDPATDLIGQQSVIDRVQWYMENADEDSKLNFSLLGLAPSWD